MVIDTVSHRRTIESCSARGSAFPAAGVLFHFQAIEEDCYGSSHGGLRGFDWVLASVLTEPDRNAQKEVSLDWSIVGISSCLWWPWGRASLRSIPVSHSSSAMGHWGEFKLDPATTTAGAGRSQLWELQRQQEWYMMAAALYPYLLPPSSTTCRRRFWPRVLFGRDRGSHARAGVSQVRAQRSFALRSA
ncbi:hypothetical protein ACQJBY_002042 [Aegilops geniculata]